LRNRALLLTIALVSVISVSLFVAIEWFDYELRATTEFFVGIEFAYGDVSDCKDLVDKVKNYTNLFVVGSPEISLNQKWLNETCDYVYDAGLTFIVLFVSHTKYAYNPYVWIIKAGQRYGDSFLGAYRIDEPGGKQLDNSTFRYVLEAKNYTEAAENYVKYLYDHLEYYLYSGAQLFTADYGLYWFDYKAGYDAVLAEFGWNHSRQLNIALCRGAAEVQNKDWGVMVTWTYNGPPYIESGDELYNDLMLSYNSGAKYVVIFDYPETEYSEYGVLTEEHFEALQKFWNYVRRNPRKHGTLKGEVAYVLPKDYGFGFRNPNDTMWGLWKADEFSKKIWDDVNNLLERHGSRLDIVYSDPKFDDALKSRYNKLISWNETVT
jgi:hypothetical protein